MTPTKLIKKKATKEFRQALQVFEFLRKRGNIKCLLLEPDVCGFCAEFAAKFSLPSPKK